jgi:hypothetical protein
VAGLIAVDVVRHPAVPRDPAAPVYLLLLAAILAGVAAALLATGRSAPLGALCGVLVAGLWAVELWAGNLASGGPLTTVAYRGSILGTLVATLAGGFLGGLRLGLLADGDRGFRRPADPRRVPQEPRPRPEDLPGGGLAGGGHRAPAGLVVGSVLGLLGGALGPPSHPCGREAWARNRRASRPNSCRRSSGEKPAR